jgi:exonuclease SbcC
LNVGTLPSQEQLAEARSALAAWRAELTVLVRQALEVAQACEAAREATRLATAAEGSLARGQAARESCQRQRQQDSEALQRAYTARDQLDGLERAAREAQQRLDAVVAIEAATAARATAVAAQQNADGELNRCQDTLQALRQEQIAGMASRLAGNLLAGDPCPVCGSTDHPAPAQGADGAVADAAIKTAERQLAAATEGARRGAAALATLEAERKALLEQAGAAALDPQAAAAAATTAAMALKLARAQAAEAITLQAAIETHDRELQVLQQTLQTATTEQALQRQAASAAGQRALTLQAEIVRVLGEGVEPRQAQRGLEPLEAALKELASGAEASSGAQVRLQQATGRLLQELSGTDFSDSAAVRAALKEESWRQELQKRIDTYDRDLIQVRGLLASEDLADLPEQRPDTAAALDGLARADASRNAALERQSEARHADAEISRLGEEHRQGDRVLGQRQEQARLLNAVADRCLGRTAPFISLQRWVLSAYLADICRYANQRLELMTSGRYQLRLTDEGGRGGRHAGLGLRVLDAYTGEEREVSSLSGGETFQASLALALGVADTVQAHSGGVHLEALFIDEGFGTLDPDNLQLAMDELDRLRDGGRMIGVISHVGALKERIRAGIAITAAEKGSRATVCRTALG